jgi:hypothetical protein
MERHLAEFCYKRKRDERLAREQANQNRYRQSHGIPEPIVPLPRGVGSVKNVGRVGDQGGRFPQRGGSERFDRRDDGVRAGERFGRLVMVLLDIPLLVLNMGLGEMITALGSRGTTVHVFPFVVLVLLPWDMGNLVTREGCLLTPLLSKWLDTGSTFFVLTPALSCWLILILFSDCRQEAWRTFG